MGTKSRYIYRMLISRLRIAFWRAQRIISVFLKVFDINSITSRDIDIFNKYQRLDTVAQKFSTLISQSGEMQRIQFFNTQKKIYNGVVIIVFA